LQRLARALVEKRTLRLDIAGRSDPEPDSLRLREDLFALKLRVQKARQLLRAGQPAGTPEALQWTPSELPALLAAAWKAEHPGRPVPPDAQALEADLRAAVRVGADELANLGLARARAAQDWLTGPGAIESARVFVTGAGAAEPAETPAGSPPPAARADFTVR
jgi:hypothetical protein